MRHLVLGALVSIIGALSACSSAPPAGIADPEPRTRAPDDMTDDRAAALEPVDETGPLPSPSDEPPLVPSAKAFDDVPAELADDVTWLVSRGIVDACGSRRFCPDAPILRREAITWAIRARFGDSFASDAGKTPTFSDVPSADPAFKYVERAFAEGIVGGYADGTFRPDGLVPRPTMAVVVVRSAEGAQFPPGPAQPYFSDVPATHFAFGAIQRARVQHLTYGCGDRDIDTKEFCAGQLTTRGSMATLLRRAFDGDFAK